jgi:organic radical activating enzyme
MLKTRCFPENNYKAIYFSGKTIRLKIDPKKEITELEYPEFYDIKLTNRCHGSCNYCYQNSLVDDNDYDAIEKLTKFFNSMNENQKPFQIAYGGGEPTLHYQFNEIMKLTRDFGISPNYTTNGMFIENENYNDIIETTKKYCEGVAITCHNHLEKFWKKCAEIMINEKIFLNFHNLIYDRKSIDYFLDIYKQYKNKIKYFVLLPMIEHGRAKNVNTEFDYFFEKIIDLKEKHGEINDIAFGANFYPYLKKYKDKIDISLYEPEILSKYLDLKDMALYKSSFNTNKVLKYIEI